MKKLFKNKKGTSLIEVIVALTVLGLISAPLTMTFLNAAYTAKMTKEQIELTAVTRIVKENAAESVKRCCDVYGNGVYTPPEKNLRDLGGTTIIAQTGLKVVDRDGAGYPDYEFDAADGGATVSNMFKLLITIKRLDNNDVYKEIRRFRMEVNVLD